eukprot:4539608-Alexandrium_andersonii.AAC.1
MCIRDRCSADLLWTYADEFLGIVDQAVMVYKARVIIIAQGRRLDPRPRTARARRQRRARTFPVPQIPRVRPAD